jgi:hypothetical protein
VDAYSNGTFTMNGGEITGNNATSRGGGVSLNGGTFTMNGGEITGNNATSRGGGVYVDGGLGTFRMVTGTIYGNEAAVSPASLRNTASNGAALFVSVGTAEYGTFNGPTWNSNGSLATTDNTIKYLNGVEVP